MDTRTPTYQHIVDPSNDEILSDLKRNPVVATQNAYNETP